MNVSPFIWLYSIFRCTKTYCAGGKKSIKCINKGVNRVEKMIVWEKMNFNHMCFTLSILPGWVLLICFPYLLSASWNSPTASFLLTVSLRNGWKHYNLIFHHICTLNNAGEELCRDSCALWSLPEAFQHRWMIVPFMLLCLRYLLRINSSQISWNNKSAALPTMPQWVSLSCHCSSTENFMSKVNKAWETHTAE